jgi:Xaa-Pro aminopeptidase
MGKIHESRRHRFMEAMEEGAAALIVSQPELARNNDTMHEYRQNSDLYYLTGFEEPEAALLFLPKHPEHRFVMFVRPRDPQKEVWTGRRAGVDGVKESFGADTSHTIGELTELLPKYLEGTDRLYVNLGQDHEKDLLALEMVNRTRRGSRSGLPGPSRLIDAATILHEMRLIKDPGDLEALETATRITAEAHCEAMRSVRPGMYEYELQAVVEYHFRKAGCHRWAYPSIIASGPNATILHYESNSRRLNEGELVLIDAGGEWGFVAADITRTFPVSGRFTPAQRKLYDVVLDAEKKAIEAAVPGAKFTAPHDAALRALVEGMIALGLLAGEPEALIQEETSYKRYFMHKTSHWLGMDVHDVGRYMVRGEARPLEPGMVLTIEPGLYVAEDDSLAPEEFRGIGIRIEDDILITETGNRILTSGVPKDPDEVERLCCGGPAAAGPRA